MLRLALALTLALSGPALAMTFETHGTAVWATGSIDDGDAGKFARALDGANATAVVLTSHGGQVSDADMMAANIRARRLPVTVDRYCESACFLMFLAGSERRIIGRSVVGVHSVNINGDETTGAMAATVYEARRAAQLGASYVTIGKMVVTPPDQIAHLTAADLREMGVLFVAAP